MAEFPEFTVADFADYLYEDINRFDAYAALNLEQASFFVQEITGVTEWPSAARLRKLFTYAIYELANKFYLERKYEEVLNSPMQSETIGSYCVDESTQILTSYGWKNHDEIKIGDEVLTLNPNTFISEWQQLEDIYKFEPSPRDMLRIKSKRFDSFTTLDHNWIVDYKGSPRWIKSRDLINSSGFSASKIPLAAPHGEFPSQPKYTDSLVELVAWLWTDGGWHWKGKHDSVRIHQSYKVNLENCIRISAALNNCFGKSSDSLRGSSNSKICASVDCETKSKIKGYCKHHYMKYWRSDDYVKHEYPITWNETHPISRPGMSVFSISAEASRLLIEHLDYETKAVSYDFIRNLTQSQLNLFIEISMLADRSGIKQLSQKEKACSESFMFACILAGKRVSMHQQKNKMWQVTHTKTAFTSPFKIKYSADKNQTENIYEIINYDGMVWCPKTPNMTWMAKREGTVYFTGNSYSRSNTAKLILSGKRPTGIMWLDVLLAALARLEQNTPGSIGTGGSVSVFENDGVRGTGDYKIVPGPARENRYDRSWDSPD